MAPPTTAELRTALADELAALVAAGDAVKIRGFGSFAAEEYGGYEGRNPTTGEVVRVPVTRLPVVELVGVDAEPTRASCRKLTARTAKRLGVTATVAAAELARWLGELQDPLRAGSAAVPFERLGELRSTHLRGRVGRNPVTGAEIPIPGRVITRFTASRAFAARLAGDAFPPLVPRALVDAFLVGHAAPAGLDARGVAVRLDRLGARRRPAAERPPLLPALLAPAFEVQLERPGTLLASLLTDPADLARAIGIQRDHEMVVEQEPATPFACVELRRDTWAACGHDDEDPWVFVAGDGHEHTLRLSGWLDAALTLAELEQLAGTATLAADDARRVHDHLTARTPAIPLSYEDLPY